MVFTSHFVICFVCQLVLFCASCVRAADGQACYTSGSVAGIVIATVVVTLIMGGLATAFIWYLWKQRKVDYGDTKSMEKPMVFPSALVSPVKQQLSRESNDYAFDNPYFKDDETDSANPDAAEKGESGFRADNGGLTTSQSVKASNGTTGHHSHPKKSRPFSSLPFHAVFHPSGKKPQRATMDDTYISKHLERLTVQLRGQDFAGLGFNICGNMRDGIYVKDVLHRGPASESGKIKAGDRIVGVTVSFGAMVYEDALTILSYASPYEIKLEIEKAPATLDGATHLPQSSPKRIGTSTSFRSNGQRRLFHPLYRSQSMDDLTQIGKDGFGNISTSGSQRESSSSATPKRSQSVEASNGGLKPRAPFVLKSDETKSIGSNKGSRKSSTSSCGSAAKATTPTEKTQPVPCQDDAVCTKKETKSARYRAEQSNVKAEAPSKVAPPVKPARESSDEKPETLNGSPENSEEPKTKSVAGDEASKPDPSPSDTMNSGEADLDNEKPTVPPRKITPKRKAPAPPPALNGRTETSAVVHREENVLQELRVSEGTMLSQKEIQPSPVSDLPPVTDTTTNKPPSNVDEPLPSKGSRLIYSSAEKIEDPGIGSSDASSVASAEHSVSKVDKDDQNASPGKRKASSLGDLTNLEKGANKKASTSSAILERAVSLDLQQSLPEENLTKQKKILHTPTFEDEDEDREDLIEKNGGLGLKRWENGLDEVFTKLPNGTTDSYSKINDVGVKITAVLNSKEVESQSQTVEDPDSETITKSSATEKSTVELLDDTPIEETTLTILKHSTTILTSTPVKKIIEVKSLDDDDIMDDVPYLDSAKQGDPEESPKKNSPTKISAAGSSALSSPVTISIPVIKPDLTHFEKLPSPPPNNTHPSLGDPIWRVSKSEDTGKTSLEKISVQPLYRPIFSSKEINNGDEALLNTSPETSKMVNGNDDSGASEHYSTAQENTSASSLETSTFSVTLSSPVVTKEVTTSTKAPNTIAGFAKTLIIPGPNEVENLLSLAAEPNTPPACTDHPPAKTVENE